MSFVFKKDPDSDGVLHIKGEDYFKFRGFELIDKTTGKPITERRYAELYNQVTGAYLPYSWNWEGELDPSRFNLYLNNHGVLIEKAPGEDSFGNEIWFDLIPARIMLSEEVEVKLK